MKFASGPGFCEFRFFTSPVYPKPDGTDTELLPYPFTLLLHPISYFKPSGFSSASHPLRPSMASFTSLVTGTPIPTPVLTKPRSSSLSLRAKPITIECSARPKKKATAHHAKTRPKKHALWDKKRGPTVYPPLPPFPPEWTLVEAGSSSAAAEVAVAEKSTAE